MENQIKKMVRLGNDYLISEDLFKGHDDEYLKILHDAKLIEIKAAAMELLKQLKDVPYLLSNEQMDVLFNNIQKDLNETTDC
jgi:hypothetical protein